MDYKSDTTLKLRTNLADYPVTKALKSEALKPSLFEFDFCGPKTAHDGFKPMLRENAFDAGELAIVTYLQAHIYGKPYALLPAPISGRTQHHCIGYNKSINELKPKDLEGKKVGVRSYAQTTGLWVRGILQHEYGVDLDKVTWLTTDESHLAEYRDPPNCRMLPKGSKLAELLYSGEIDAAILGNDMPDDPRIATLIPNAMEEGKKWSERENIVPINHMFVVHKDLLKSRPNVVKEIFRLLVESRKAAPPALLPPFGLEANRKGIQMAIDWSYEQKIIPRRPSVDELFDETTAALVP
jgi:4,5-dihydroxyphthalate decarboxylase